MFEGLPHISVFSFTVIEVDNTRLRVHKSHYKYILIRTTECSITTLTQNAKMTRLEIQEQNYGHMINSHNAKYTAIKSSQREG